MGSKFNLDFDAIRKVTTWRDFDEEFTIKVHPPFKSACQYYYEASCLNHVSKITVPTLVMHSYDDPVVPADCVPVDECLANKNIITAFTRRGGHCCYFMGSDGAKRWYSLASAEFLNEALSELRERIEEP